MEFRPRRKTQFEESPRKKRSTERKEIFDVGEKILCYEPDGKLEKVLYDAKIISVAEGKDKRNRKLMEYQIHFQGWNSSWDRRVSEDFILKDTPENRKLQRELAEKSQLQLGAYLYRKERKKRRKEHNKLVGETSEDGTKKPSENDQNTDPEQQELEYYSSSATESNHDDDRVYLHIGDTLKTHLENDFKMVTKENLLTLLPASTPVVTILENFVKTYSIKLITGPTTDQSKLKRRNSQAKKEAKTFDYDSIRTNIDLCKEVVDGLRVYFNFTLKDFLLYSEEKDEVEKMLSEENLKDFKYTPTSELSLDLFLSKLEPPSTPTEQVPESVEAPGTPSQQEERSKRLRSHSCRTEEDLDTKPENMSSMASTSSGESTTLTGSKRILTKSGIPLNISVTPIARKIIEEVFSWKMIPITADPEPSMIFGINHLTRLVVKLPEFLSATPISEEKLMTLLKFLDSFVEYLEENDHLFGIQNYKSLLSTIPNQELVLQIPSPKQESIDEGTSMKVTTPLQHLEIKNEENIKINNDVKVEKMETRD